MLIKMRNKLNPGKDAAATAKRGLADVIELVKASEPAPSLSLAEIDSEIARATKRRADLFEIEDEARAFVSREIARLRLERGALLARGKYDGKFRTIPLDVLGWRDDRGLPTLVPFDLGSPRFSIEARTVAPLVRVGRYDRVWYDTDLRLPVSIKVVIKPDLPKAMSCRYDDVVRAFKRRAEAGTVGAASATFAGVIPEDIRALINEVKTSFQRIFIIAEARMDYTEVKIPVGDPIVAGWDGVSLYYLADFDTTAVEEAALLEGPHIDKIGESP